MPWIYVAAADAKISAVNLMTSSVANLSVVRWSYYELIRAIHGIGTVFDRSCEARSFTSYSASNQ
jgi:hypothetical protein